MAVSLLNTMVAEKVEALLNDPHVRDDLKDDQRGFRREQALAIIHAALWAYSARAGSTAEAYARLSLFEAIGLKSWSFKEPERPAPETVPAPEASIVEAFRRSPRRVPEACGAPLDADGVERCERAMDHVGVCGLDPI